MSSVISRGYIDASIDDGKKEKENDMTMNQIHGFYLHIYKKKKKLPIECEEQGKKNYFFFYFFSK